MTSAELSQWLAELHGEVQQTNPQFPNNLVAGWPIPFFGDVINARVLTVGVNPSDHEFNVNRRWHEVRSVSQWRSRLDRYFQNTEVPPWIWFETWAICLKLIDLGYAPSEAAHIDISPRPTSPMLSPGTDKAEFRSMVDHDVKWFFDLLNRLPQVQLLLVAGPIPRANGTKQQLAAFIREHARAHGAEWMDGEPLPRLVFAARPQGIPVFVCRFEPELDGLHSMIHQVYKSFPVLRGLAGPPPHRTPIVPARLDWPSATGSYLLGFGSLEYFVTVYLKDHLPAAEFEKVKEWHLKDRLERIRQHLAGEHRPQLEQDRFAALVERVIPLRELRNHIAHGQMHVRIHPETGEPKVTLLKAKEVDFGGQPEIKELGFAELERALTEIAQVNREFERFAGFTDES